LKDLEKKLRERTGSLLQEHPMVSKFHVYKENKK